MSEPASPDPGYYLLNADAGRRRAIDPESPAAIGAVLRTRQLVPVAQISKVIGPVTHNVAEYQALIEGLKLARVHGVQHLRVYMDSTLVVDQMLGESKVLKPHLAELRAEATALIEGFKSHRISWVPREWNDAADRLVNEAFDAG